MPNPYRKKTHHNLATIEPQRNPKIGSNRDNPFTNSGNTKIYKAMKEKELDLLNCAGPHSIPERHYPQTVTALPFPEEYIPTEDTDETP